MSKLEELLKKLCPNGVEYQELGDVCVFNRGTPLLSKEAQEGDVPVISGGKTPAFYHNIANRYGETITIAASGAYAGYVQYFNRPIWAADSFTVDTKYNIDLNKKYIYYFLQSMQQNIYNTKRGSGVPHVYGSSVAQFKIPVPPLEVQCEIVRILDNFTELTAKLTAKLAAELSARKKQYEFYRDKLLSFDNLKDTKTLKIIDIAKVYRGTRVVKSQLMLDAKYPVYQNSLEPMGYYYKSNVAKEKTYVISAGAAGAIGYCDIDFWAADDCLVIESESVNNKYIYYYLLTKSSVINSKVRKASIPRLSREVIENMQIVIPSLEIQKRIVNVLDNFDKICSDLNIGLPTEIEARNKQYEYYRDLLLSFSELTGGGIN
ncbi:MAG: restriction endonuclease subunit S [Erysipelotrichales bacterium]|nr:restriction endonuclease subunit S [Erysipelotrichales bacterium]